MSDNTKIEWADAPLFVELNAIRISTDTGQDVVRLDETAVRRALKWKRPRHIFWNAHGDTFHESVPDAWIDRVFAVAALTPQHTHMILTKRSKRMREYVSALPDRCGLVGDEAAWGFYTWSDPYTISDRVNSAVRKPLPNVWLGVSVEDQTRADERIPDLLATPAAVRFLSCEPLLGPVNVRQWLNDYGCSSCGYGGTVHERCRECGWHGDCSRQAGPCPECGEQLQDDYACPACGEPDGEGDFGPTVSSHRLGLINWVIAGGESGPDARPMHPDWARSLRDQCADAGVPFHFKQWGEWAPSSLGADIAATSSEERVWRDDAWTGHAISCAAASAPNTMNRVGKKRAGRLLDGVEHNGFRQQIAPTEGR